ncbi:hypothetical protein HGB13_00540 [bacterium]|nr:hypothetical protein [bacterium]
MNIFFEKRMLLTLLTILLGLESVIVFPNQKIVISVMLLVFFASALFWVLHIRPKEKESLPIFILPLILLLEASIVVNLIVSWPLKQVFILLFCGLLYLVIFSLESLKKKIESYVVIIHNILTISVYVGTFLGYVLIYDSLLRGTIVLGVGMLLAALTTVAFFVFFLWHNENLSKKNLLEIIIFSLIGTQFFWTISFLPLMPLQSGFVLFMIFYLFMDIFMFEISGYISLRKVSRHIIIPGAVLILFLSSIKW